MFRRITNDISNIIETRKYDDRDSRKLEKLMKDMQSVLKSEVDDRIPKIRADAVEKSDAQWKGEIANNYVRKEKVAGLENTIKEKNNIIVKLRSEIEKSDRNLIAKENKISRLEIQLDETYDKNTYLNNENRRLNKYMDERFDLDIKIKLDKLNNEINVFNSKKKTFFQL